MVRLCVIQLALVNTSQVIQQNSEESILATIELVRKL